ncbi:hypothetical protein ACHAQA_009063 [Verticillium albo-atrum]
MKLPAFISCFAAGAVLAQWNHDLFKSSPPVYPSPEISGLGWDDALEKAKEFLGELTLEEKAWMVTGTPGPCNGNIAPIERLNFTGLCLMDGPVAVRSALFASVFPAGLTVGASWDRNLMNLRGKALGAEFRGKGAHVALGPSIGALGRSAFGGRNWEAFSVDPYLTGVGAEETVAGIQSQGVQTSVKHYIGNEQEKMRSPADVNGTTVFSYSSNIDDQTMHELYLWPFYNAVKAGTASIMCSYNRLNSSYACQNSKTLNGLLKTDLGFEGYVLSDWGATLSGVSSIKAGLDMNMPGGTNYFNTDASLFGGNITIGVNNGSLPIERVDDMVLRVITPYFALGQDKDFPPVDPSVVPFGLVPPSWWVRNFTLGDKVVDVRDDHAKLIREVGAAGTVLLKNTNGTLPLKAPKIIAVYGDDAADQLVSSTPVEAIGSFEILPGTGGYSPLMTKVGTLAAGGGSGTGRFANLVSPLDAIRARARKDGALVQYIVSNDLVLGMSVGTSQDSLVGPFINPAPEVCLVFLKSYASESTDRKTLLPENQGTEVVEKVALSCPNTVVVLHGAAPNVLPFATNPNVTAILAAHLPGEETGNSIVDVLYGDVNPSGKLPYTIAKTEKDYPNTLLNLTISPEDPDAWQADYIERQLIDYRYFDVMEIEPRYEFGFGLSYTDFSIENLKVDVPAGSRPRTPPPRKGPVPPGGHPALWDVVTTVAVTVSNTGSIAGAAVPQLYLHLGCEAGPKAPLKVLRGFEKVYLEPGESREVGFKLMRRDVSYWNAKKQTWQIPAGEIKVMAGFSSRDTSLVSSFKV